ncbi:hypothetical protein N3K66_002054 [Trichothecium roseum]|uniref:Uncharacterized protein n=1 Tax=Trichothecium roseum TaxID=47278 RepID=A0ACC0V8H9_9HYPO|nr:hypothetical protein N3K66_002054 [Trichothecium roseum]
MELPAWHPHWDGLGPKELGPLVIAAALIVSPVLSFAALRAAVSLIPPRALSRGVDEFPWEKTERHVKVGTVPSPPGDRRLSSPDDGKSNGAEEVVEAAEEAEEEEEGGGGQQAATAPRVQSLHIYPVKSCRGIELQRSRVLPTGLEFDRVFTFALREEEKGKGEGEHEGGGGTMSKTEQDGDGDDGPWRFLTQRTAPMLASVRVDLWVLPAETGPDSNTTTATATTTDEGGVAVITFPWKQQRTGGLREALRALWSRVTRETTTGGTVEFAIPLAFPTPQTIAARGYAFDRVKVWKDLALALNMSSELPPELHAYLALGPRTRLALFRADTRQPSTATASGMGRRQVFRCAPRSADVGFQPVVDFQDAYPLHLLNLRSLRDFGAKFGDDALDARRFRANIIVDGAEEYDEETWRSISVSAPARTGTETETETETGTGTGRRRCLVASHFDVSARMVRCPMVDVDQDSGARQRRRGLFRSLCEHRDVDEGAPRLGCLGMSLCPVFPDATAAAGAAALDDRLESVIEVGMELSVMQRGTHLYIPM